MNHKQDIYMSKDKIKKLKEEKTKQFNELVGKREAAKKQLQAIEDRLILLKGQYKMLEELEDEQKDSKKD